MRIAIDARELRGKPTGVGRYLSGLLGAWRTLPAAAPHQFVLCAPGPIDLGAAGPQVTTLVRSGRNRSAGTVWEQLTLPAMVREANADVLFCPGYTAPLRCRVPVVVAVHDVSFAARPEWFGRREGFRRRLLVRLSARRAARIVTISEFSKQEIVGRLGVEAGRVDVAYPGTTGWPRTADEDHDAAGSLVLFVGSLFMRRHVPELIEGFAQLARRRTDVTLEIVGDNRTTPRLDFDSLIARTGLADRIALRSYVTDDALGGLYARARAFAFLSEYEGFGLTPVEALAAGVPIVALDTPVAREVYGDAAVYVPRPDPSLVAAALDRVLFDAAERGRILEASAPLLRRYSWDTCAARVLDILTASASTRRTP